MFEIGPFTVIGEREAMPQGLAIRLLPHEHHAAFPWWSPTTQAVLVALGAEDIVGKRVLDFGCGASAILGLAASALGGRVSYAEHMPELWAIAVTNIAANGLDPTQDDGGRHEFILANLGDAYAVGQLAQRAPHGLGTDAEGQVIRW